MSVVYFNQQTGALHAVRWLKSFVSALKELFHPSTTESKDTFPKKFEGLAAGGVFVSLFL